MTEHSDAGSPSSFQTLASTFERLRLGDEAAARWFFEVYGPSLRREIRLNFRDEQLRRVVDSSDIFQSVMRSFFVGCRLGEFEFRSPAELLSLLRTIARNKINSQRRYHRAAQRDLRRQSSLQDPDVLAAAVTRTLPQGHDTLEDVLSRLDEPNRNIARLRLEGYTWPEIANACGDAEDNIRKRFRRALNQVLESFHEGEKQSG